MWAAGSDPHPSLISLSEAAPGARWSDLCKSCCCIFCQMPNTGCTRLDAAADNRNNWGEVAQANHHCIGTNADRYRLIDTKVPSLFHPTLVYMANKFCSQVAFQLIPPTSWAEQEKICKRKWKEQTWTLNLYHMLKVIEALLKCKLNGVISVIRFARSSSSHSVPQNIQHPLLSHFHSALRVTLKCQCSSCGSKGRVKQNVSF